MISGLLEWPPVTLNESPFRHFDVNQRPDCDPGVEIMSRAFRQRARYQLRCKDLGHQKFGGPFLSVSALGYVGRLFVGLLGLLSQPTMLLNPFLSFGSGMKMAEVMPLVSWPRHFDAPMVPLDD